MACGVFFISIRMSACLVASYPHRGILAVGVRTAYNLSCLANATFLFLRKNGTRNEALFSDCH